MDNKSIFKEFDLSGRVAVITGGAGLLGRNHAESLASAGAKVVLFDIDKERAESAAEKISRDIKTEVLGLCVDITSKDEWVKAVDIVLNKFSSIDILVNNAANNPKVEDNNFKNFTRFENFLTDQWNDDLSVGLTGAFLGAQVAGKVMAERQKGVIVNIASDLSVIAPDQRIYRKDGLPEHMQNVKPVSYSVVKHALIGLTKYLAVYWASKNIRANAISPGGVYVSQDDKFVSRLTNLIPMGKMAREDEYKAALLFLCSDASSYMTGQNLIIDGGRTVW